MKPIIVGISDCRISADPASDLITYALGSCIAVMLYDRALRVGGLLHYMLPDSSLDSGKAKSNPYMFADTGIPLLLEKVCAAGANPKKLTVNLAGGAQVLDPQNVFAIGKRNYLAAKKVLWRLGLVIGAEAVGGEHSRTVRLEIATGKGWLREGGKAESELVAAPPASLFTAAQGGALAATPAGARTGGNGLWRSTF